MRRVLTLTLLALTFPATSAAADGGPVPPVQGGSGVTAAGSPFNFIALTGGNHSTVIQRVRRGDGVVQRYRVISGDYGVPGVAFDGSTTGLSADSRTLVLASTSRYYPPKTTRLVVLDPIRLLERTRITLPGAWVVDAISPDGRWLYFTHYRAPTQSLNYEVRAYDLQQRQLIPKPVVDPREPDEKMQGQPVTRLMSPDGRFAYTLYAGGDAPFVHALDTQNRTAACIDLPMLSQANDIFAMRLRLNGRTLSVVGGTSPVALVDTRSWAARSPAATRQPARPVPMPGKSDGGSSFPWALMAIPAAATLAGLGVVARRRRRFRSAPA